ncbi:MAG: hypothetical protein ACREYF_09125 [Gammaproteobacteria bacterium]
MCCRSELGLNLAWLLFFQASAATHASEVRHLEVSAHRGRYRVEIEVLINADQESVQNIVQDHNGLYRLSRIIRRSRDLGSLPGQLPRRELTLEACIRFFCMAPRMIEEIERQAHGDIITRIVPEESDFSYGGSHWRTWRVSAQASRIELNAELTPAFWVPPLIGPWVLKHKLRVAALETCERLERLARGPQLSP